MLIRPYPCFFLLTAPDLLRLKKSSNQIIQSTLLRNPEQRISKSLVVIPDMNYESVAPPATLIPKIFLPYINLPTLSELFTPLAPYTIPLAGNEFLKHTICYLSGISHFCLS